MKPRNNENVEKLYPLTKNEDNENAQLSDLRHHMTNGMSFDC